MRASTLRGSGSKSNWSEAITFSISISQQRGGNGDQHLPYRNSLRSLMRLCWSVCCDGWKEWKTFVKVEPSPREKPLLWKKKPECVVWMCSSKKVANSENYVKLRQQWGGITFVLTQQSALIWLGAGKKICIFSYTFNFGTKKGKRSAKTSATRNARKSEHAGDDSEKWGKLPPDAQCAMYSSSDEKCSVQIVNYLRRRNVCSRQQCCFGV